MAEVESHKPSLDFGDRVPNNGIPHYTESTEHIAITGSGHFA